MFPIKYTVEILKDTSSKHWKHLVAGRSVAMDFCTSKNWKSESAAFCDQIIWTFMIYCEYAIVWFRAFGLCGFLHVRCCSIFERCFFVFVYTVRQCFLPCFKLTIIWTHWLHFDCLTIICVGKVHHSITVSLIIALQSKNTVYCCWLVSWMTSQKHLFADFCFVSLQRHFGVNH